MALTPFRSRLIADTGIGFGDEGKGRLISEVVRELQQVDERKDAVHMVLKVNGGANSGHTAGGLKLNLLPGGVIESDVTYLGLGMGVVADPRKLWWETKSTESKGFSVLNRLRIDERTMVSDISHRLLDLAWESYRENILHQTSRGSTGRGITPAYLDEVGQWQIYFHDFLSDKDSFARKLRERMDRAVCTIKHVCQVSEEVWYSFFERLTDAETRANQNSLQENVFSKDEFDFSRFSVSEPFSLNAEAIIESYWEAGCRFRHTIVDIRDLVLEAQNNSQTVIGEFGQAYWLDKRHGFAPNVTASHSYTPEFFQSAGIPVQPLHTFGVCKAYDTKVGTHEFLTRIPEQHSLYTKLSQLEFGTSTGRQRMVGWFDAVEKGTALRYGGFDDLVINKLDALTQGNTWEGNLKICTKYKDDEGRFYYQVPRQDSLRSSLTPVYEELPAWDEDISSVRSFPDLPEAARRYVAAMLQSILRCAGIKDGNLNPLPVINLRYIGVGPDPDEIIKDIPPVSEILNPAIRHP